MNNFNNNKYTRIDKIRYYIGKIASHVPEAYSVEVNKALGALDYLTSDRYIDKDQARETVETIKKISKRKYKKGA